MQIYRVSLRQQGHSTGTENQVVLISSQKTDQDVNGSRAKWELIGELVQCRLDEDVVRGYR
jgi:hypothetical protein